MKKRIGLFLGSDRDSGGMFQYSLSVLEAISRLPEDMFECIVGYTNDHWLDYLKEYAIPAVYVPLGFWGRFFGALWRVSGLPLGTWRYVCRYFHPVAKTLLKQKCDLWFFPSQDRWSYLIPVPSLGTIHDLMHRYEPGFPEVSDQREYRLREYQYSNMCRWTRGVIVDSSVGKQHVQESYGVPAERIFVLPYVIPKYFYEVQAPADFELRYQLPDKFLFYPAHFWEHKNHKILIRSIARLKIRIPDINLVLVGSRDNGYDSALNLVHRLGVAENVHFLGYVPDRDMPEIYRRARAMVMPTFFGPTNIPPLEAFATGCPAAVSRIYGMPEQVGDAALLFDPGSLDEISEVMFRLWTDDQLCRDLMIKGLAKSKNWNQSHFDKRVFEIIHELTHISGVSL